MPERRLNDILAQVLKSLRDLYKTSNYHGNIKPSNIGISVLKTRQGKIDSIFTLMDCIDVIPDEKAVAMMEGDIEKNQYSINLAYKSRRSFRGSQVNDGDGGRADDDIFALGVTLLRAACNLRK